MTYEPLNRRLAIVAALFAFLGVVLGVIALATNYWTLGVAVDSIRNGALNVDRHERGYAWNVCILFLIFSDIQFVFVLLYLFFVMIF
jgi:hypothetical protein